MYPGDLPTANCFQEEFVVCTAVLRQPPDLSFRAIFDPTLFAQPIGGAAHVDRDSSLEFLWDAKFLNNTLAYQTDQFWVRVVKTHANVTFTEAVVLLVPRARVNTHVRVAPCCKRAACVC